MKRITFGVRVEVPDDLFAWAQAVAKLEGPWREMQETLKGTGLKFEVYSTQAAVPTSSGNGRRTTNATGTKRQRKKREDGQPQLPVADESE